MLHWKEFLQECIFFLSKFACVHFSPKHRQSVVLEQNLKFELTSVVVCWLKVVEGNIVSIARLLLIHIKGALSGLLPHFSKERKKQQVVNKSFSLRLDCTGIDMYNTVFELD